MEYVRSLDFEERPDYKYLITIFKDLYHKSGFKDDYQYDWAVLQVKFYFHISIDRKKQWNKPEMEESHKNLH